MKLFYFASLLCLSVAVRMNVNDCVASSGGGLLDCSEKKDTQFYGDIPDVYGSIPFTNIDVIDNIKDIEISRDGATLLFENSAKHLCEAAKIFKYAVIYVNDVKCEVIMTTYNN